MSDLSVVLTVHNETTVSGPTMRAADVAVAAARADGLTVETILALDKATPASKSYFAQSRFDHWSRHAIEEGDLGRARNAILPTTNGRYIAFLDADDLFSQNWLVEGVRRLRRADSEGRRVIAHPELNVLFDGANTLVRNIPSSSPLFTPYFAYLRNYYDALCLAPREAHEQFPYSSIEVSQGVGYEDWQFGLETLDGGWEHVIVPDTIIFKRRRDESLVTRSNTQRLLIRKIAAMAIDRIRDLGAASR